MNKLRAAFRDHRSHAKRRRIEFLLTFDEWINIWEASGKLAQRGSRDGQYCMARFGDKGPYAVGNIEIKTVNKNISEAWKGKKRPFRHKSVDHSARIANALRGRPAHQGEQNGHARLTVEQVLEIREAVGLQREIAARFGICQTTVSGIKRRKKWASIS